MSRQVFRVTVAIALVVLTVIAAMLWGSEYDSNADPEARFEIQSAKLIPDHGYAWLEVHLEKSGEKNHDLEQRVRLVTADGTKHDPADTTFAGTPEKGFTDIWFKFWLEQGQLEGDLALEINNGVLKVKDSQSVPDLEKGEEKVFRSVDWEKSWLGF